MRTKRRESVGDIYHVVQRGSGGQVLFESDEDRVAYVELLKKVAGESDEFLEIYAWCLMSNHVHLLIHGNIAALSTYMKRVATSYAMRFNRKYGRTGHLFQDRFWSEPVNDDTYLMQVVRYIHSNPLKTGSKTCADYRWSSYREYLGEVGQGLASTEFVLDVLGGINEFVSFHSTGAEYSLPQSWNPRHCVFATDDEALVAAREVLGAVSPYDLRSLDMAERRHALAKLRAAGLSIRQISRITGISKGAVEYSLKTAN